MDNNCLFCLILDYPSSRFRLSANTDFGQEIFDLVRCSALWLCLDCLLILIFMISSQQYRSIRGEIED